MIVKLIFLAITLVLGLIFLIGIVKHLIKVWPDKKKRLLFGGWIISLAAIIYIPILIVNEFATKYQHTTYSSSWQTIDSNFERDSLTKAVHSHYEDIANFKNTINSLTAHINYPKSFFKDDFNNILLIDNFKQLIASPDTLESDYGYVLLAIHQNNMEKDPTQIQNLLDLVNDQSIDYFNYAQAFTYYRHYSISKIDTVEYYLLESIAENNNNSDSYALLSRLYYHSDQPEKLAALLNDENTSEFVPYWVKRGTYFSDIDFINYWSTILSVDIEAINAAGFFAAFIILCFWMFFLRKMDIYEPEKWHHLIITFLLSIVCMHLLYPAHDFLWDILEYNRPSNPVSDFGYLTVSVGMVEEFVKILPVLIMLKFSKGINEPFDYILYASVSALGFAFVENIGYFGDQELGNIAIRGFQCCLVHIAFSSTVAYGLMLGKYRKNYNKYGIFILFFVIASAFHGFYDFWLMDWWAVEYDWVSSITTLVLLHLWVTYANNTLNISNFYHPEVQFKTDWIKYLAFTIFVAILMLSYTIVSFNYGWWYGNHHLTLSAFDLLLVVSYFALSLGFMSITRGYIKPLQLPFNFLFPSKKSTPNLSDEWIQLTPSPKFSIDTELTTDKESLLTTAQLTRQVVIDDSLNAYLVTLSTPITVNGELVYQVIITPEWEGKSFNHSKRVLTQIYLINDFADLDKAFLHFSDFKMLGRVFSKHIKAPQNNKIVKTENPNQTALSS